MIGGWWVEGFRALSFGRSATLVRVGSRCVAHVVRYLVRLALQGGVIIEDLWLEDAENALSWKSRFR